jgi:hypothetical protein
MEETTQPLTWQTLWAYARAANTINHQMLADLMNVPGRPVTVGEVTALVNDHAEQWHAHPLCNEGFGKVCVKDGDVRLVGWTPDDHRRRGDRWVPGDKVPGVTFGGERNGKKNGNGNGRHLRTVK